TQPVIVNGKPVKRVYSVGTNSAKIDLAIPDSLNANINFFSNSGQVYSNLNFKAMPSSPKDIKTYAHDFNVQPGLKTIALNNGGSNININLSTNYGNIYLR